MPAVEKKSTVLFLIKTPTKSRSSPKKLEVPGKPIFAIEKRKKAVAKRGILVTTPP